MNDEKEKNMAAEISALEERLAHFCVGPLRLLVRNSNLGLDEEEKNSMLRFLDSALIDICIHLDEIVTEMEQGVKDE